MTAPRSRTSWHGWRSPGPTSRPRPGIRPRRSQRCLQVLDARRPRPGHRGQGAGSSSGLMRMRTGETDAALEAFARAIAVLPPGSDDLGFALLNRGNVHLQHGRARAGGGRLRRGAGRSWTSPDSSSTRAKAEHNLGYAQLLDGRPDRRHDDDRRGGATCCRRRRRSTARPSSRTAPRSSPPRVGPARRPGPSSRRPSAYGSRRLRTFQAECELTLAWTLLREDPVKARVVARRAARRFRGQASPARELRADAVALVAEIAAGGRSRSLLERADQLAAALHEHGLVRDAAVLQLQGARVSVRPRGARRREAAAGAVRVDVSTPVTTRLLWREVRAELAHARGDAPARTRPRPGRARRPAHLAVLVREPRPAEHPRRTRPRPGQAGPEARRSSTAIPRWSSSGPSAPGPWSAGSARCARRPTSRWPAT